MNQVMQYDFNKEFITIKKQKEQGVANLKLQIRNRQRTVLDTNSNRLKSEVQSKHAQNLALYTDYATS